MAAVPARRIVVVAVACLLALTTGSWVVLWPAQAPPTDGLTIPWWALTAFFAVCEVFVLHVQIRREAQSVSLSEIPFVLGLIFVDPLVLAVSRVVGAVAVFAFHRRQGPLKLAYNTAMVTAEVSVAILAWTLAAGPATFPEPRALMAAYAACAAAALVGGVSTQVVIGSVEGSLSWSDVKDEVTRYTPLTALVATFGLVSAYALQRDVRSAIFLAVCGVVLLGAYRSYARLNDRHLSLERLYRFSQAVGSSPEGDQVLNQVLNQAMELLRAERAQILLLSSGQDDHAAASVTLDASGRLRRAEIRTDQVPALLRSALVDEGRPVLLRKGTRHHPLQSFLEDNGHRDLIGVPLRGEAGVLGMLLVTDRMGEVRSFDDSDVLLLETVANHAGVALNNGRLMDKLRHDALHDGLTGLANRVLFQREAEAAVLDARGDVTTAVMVLDLDGFKEVNDNLGHQCGDQVLCEVATRLTDAAGERALVARLGGDEFAVLLPACPDPAYAEGVGERILHALEMPVRVQEMDIQIGGSIGVALAPLHTREVAALLIKADVAMYAAKAQSGTMILYSPEMDSRAPNRLAIAGELRTAIREGHLTVHVQPQARISDGQVVAVEALVRWEHPTRGLVFPDEFIPAAERSGLIGQLTREVLGEAVAAAALWTRAGPPLRIAVNLSARSLLDPDLVEMVARTLRRHGLDPGHLTLEITESSVMADPRRTLGVLEQLRALGVALSVDDFGTGYSSLSYLKRLPVQEVKIDKSFVLALADNPEDESIVRSIVDLGANLGLSVVAEGVEDQRAWDLLAAMGCTYAQGYFLGRPMPTPDLLPWLAARHGSDGGVPAAVGVRTLPAQQRDGHPW
jgi:diguanylate cyclase (GGDEF)-like protein